MPTDHFSYRGPATIAGTPFPDVVLREVTAAGGLRSWSGRATTTTDLSAQFLNSPAVEVELPDGRTGSAYLSLSFDGRAWDVEITGTGPAPGAAGR